MPRDTTRRRVMQATAGVGTVLIAGCTDFGSDDGDSSGNDESMEEDDGSMEDNESMDDGSMEDNESVDDGSMNDEG